MNESIPPILIIPVPKIKDQLQPSDTKKFLNVLFIIIVFQYVQNHHLHALSHQEILQEPIL